MNEDKITDLTRELIDACGGLEVAARHCRVKLTQLSRCQTHGSGCFLALDVVIALEAYCKRPIISAAMIEAVPDKRRTSDLRDEAGEHFEAAADLHKIIRLADRAKPSARREIRNKITVARNELADVEAALDAFEQGAC